MRVHLRTPGNAEHIHKARSQSCAPLTHAEQAKDSKPVRGVQPLFQLQRQYGNRYVQRLLAQTRKGGGGASASPDVERTIRQAHGGGQVLDSGVRAQMEPAFVASFGSVRVHANAEADTLNRSLNPRAFTTGQDIFFRQGACNPGSSSGRELLAHELTREVQQNNDRVQRRLAVGQPGDRYEQAADQVARAVSQQGQQPIQNETDERLARRRVEEDEEEESVQAKVGEAKASATPEPLRKTVSADTIKKMNQEVECIVAILNELVIDADNEEEILSHIEKWARIDEKLNAHLGTSDSVYLDEILGQLDRRVFSKGTARTAWVDFSTNALDDLFRELEDDRLVRFRELLSRSQKYARKQPSELPPSFASEVVGKTFRQYPAAFTGFISGVAEKAEYVPLIGPWIKKEVAPFYREYAREVAKFYGVEEEEVEGVVERGQKLGRVGMSFLRGYYAIYVLLGNVINFSSYAIRNPDKIEQMYNALRLIRKGLNRLSEDYPDYYEYLEAQAKEQTIRQLIAGVKDLDLEAWAEVLGATAKFGVKAIVENVLSLKNTIAFAILQLLRFIKLSAIQRIKTVKKEFRELRHLLEGRNADELLNRLKEIGQNLEELENLLKELEEEALL